uniref:Uncharacterized protein n=1 Tax=Cyprinus carpio carpio TaxID=630221 RepID=A0A9J8ASB1_CYPCA
LNNGNSVQNNRESGVLVVLRGSWGSGSVHGGKGPGKGRSPVAARAPLLGPRPKRRMRPLEGAAAPRAPDPRGERVRPPDSAPYLDPSLREHCQTPTNPAARRGHQIPCCFGHCSPFGHFIPSLFGFSSCLNTSPR